MCHRSSVGSVVYNRVSNDAILIIEVDGPSHEDDPPQLARDAIQDEILRSRGMPLLRLKRTENDEYNRIRAALDQARKRSPGVPSAQPHDT